MQYFIDHANKKEVNEVLKFGINAITANPTMYKNNHTTMIDFLTFYKNHELSFLSAEVMGATYAKMLQETKTILSICPHAVIKINFSKEGLRLANHLHNEGIKTAMTLIFSISQVIAACNAHVDYVFFFVGRNDEYGDDGLKKIAQAQRICTKFNISLVAASIKNLHQLNALSDIPVDYAAISYSLYYKSLQHPLTEQGKQTFQKDWNT
ncbi:MAG: transaldolase family protein [Breznakia sp.]